MPGAVGAGDCAGTRSAQLTGGRLQPTSAATTVRASGHEILVADGPFAETKEQILGFDVIECADLDEAIYAASRHPVAAARRRRRGAAVPARRVTGPAGMTDAEAAVAAAFREEWGKVVATLIRMTGDWDLAEECAQDAFATALSRWDRDGVPDRPGAWLTTTARNRALDRLRRSKTEAAKLQEVAALTVPDEPAALDESGVADDRLRLMFTCCHPALTLEARVALTLRTLAGLTTAGDRQGVPGA